MSGVAACNRLFKTLCLSASLLLCALPAQAELQLFFVHNDHLNTPKYLTDTTGKAVWQSQATPFGEVTENGDLDGDGKYVTLNMRFPGQYWDHETGTSYNYYRDYDPSLGRYVQSDPIGLGGGINTFGYVLQNPIRFSDPFGLAPWDYDGYGDTSICSYYEQRAKETCGDLKNYYSKAGAICRGKESAINFVVNRGIETSWLTGKTTKSQSDIYNQIRAGLVQNDSLMAASKWGVDGNTIDNYHNVVYRDVGLYTAFYGGNLLPQGVSPNPVPFDKDGKLKLDPRQLWSQKDDCSCSAK